MNANLLVLIISMLTPAAMLNFLFPCCLAQNSAVCVKIRVCGSGTALAWLTLEVIVHILP